MNKLQHRERRTILVIDDDHSFSRSVYNVLTSMHVEVHRARSAQQAIELLDDLKPDLVLIDMVLPDVSGLALLRRLRASEDHKRVPVLMTSAFVMAGDRREAIGAGANEFLPKPFSITDLETAAAPLLGQGFMA
ncbi:MAG: response regulator [Anaerolineales bacterium]|nr:response regulator [Anaerolineales bacterium]